MNNLFEEHQYQRRLLPWILVAGIWIASIWHIYNYGISSEQPIYNILILLILPLTITLLLFFFKLSIKIDNKYLMFRMFPFHWIYRKIKLCEIVDATIKEYNTNRSFHGWGLGITRRGRYKSYTVKGYNGVEILLKNGEEIFIGTQQPESITENLKIVGNIPTINNKRKKEQRRHNNVYEK